MLAPKFSAEKPRSAPVSFYRIQEKPKGVERGTGALPNPCQTDVTHHRQLR
jgi:hypothetical protein